MKEIESLTCVAVFFIKIHGTYIMRVVDKLEERERWSGVYGYGVIWVSGGGVCTGTKLILAGKLSSKLNIPDSIRRRISWTAMRESIQWGSTIERATKIGIETCTAEKSSFASFKHIWFDFLRMRGREWSEVI